MRRRASWSRSCFWNCKGVIAVTPLKWWWKPETLIPSSRAMSSIRSGWSKSLRSRSMASTMRWVEPPALLPHKEPVDDPPGPQRREEACFGGGAQEPDEPHHGVQQARIQRAHVDGLHGGMVTRRGVTGLDHDRADEGGIELEAE